jgi:hypothetical protein
MTEPTSSPPNCRSRPSRLCVLLGAGLLSGCASSNYLTDRWNDAKDICTASVGVGGGAKARVGPIGTGVHWIRDYAGLRGGDVGALQPETNDTSDFGVLLFGGETSPETEAMRLRDKEYMSSQWFFFYTPAMFDDDHHPKAHFYTQVEVVAGAGGSVRFGFNPGELVDFLFGWLGADLFGDDQARLRPKPESEPAKEDPQPGAE